MSCILRSVYPYTIFLYILDYKIYIGPRVILFILPSTIYWLHANAGEYLNPHNLQIQEQPSNLFSDKISAKYEPDKRFLPLTELWKGYTPSCLLHDGKLPEHHWEVSPGGCELHGPCAVGLKRIRSYLLPNMKAWWFSLAESAHSHSETLTIKEDCSSASFSPKALLALLFVVY